MDKAKRSARSSPASPMRSRATCHAPTRRRGVGNVLGDQRAAKALSTTGVATGGALIPQAFSSEIIELLRARAVVRRAGPRIYSTPGGNLTIPRATSASIAAYQGELDEVVSSQPAYDDLQLNAKKMTALVPVSNDLLRRPPVNLDELIRNDFIEAVALREDIAFLTGDGSLGGPVGLVNHVPPSNTIVAMPLIGMSNAQIVTTVVGLLRGMQAILRNSMCRMIRPTWIGGPGAFELFRGLRDDMGGFLFETEMGAGQTARLSLSGDPAAPNEPGRAIRQRHCPGRSAVVGRRCRGHHRG